MVSLTQRSLPVLPSTGKHYPFLLIADHCAAGNDGRYGTGTVNARLKDKSYQIITHAIRKRVDTRRYVTGKLLLTSPPRPLRHRRVKDFRARLKRDVYYLEKPRRKNLEN